MVNGRDTSPFSLSSRVRILPSTLHVPVVVPERLEAVTTQFSAVPSAFKTKCSSFGFSKTIVVLRQCPTKTRAPSEIGSTSDARAGIQAAMIASAKG